MLDWFVGLLTLLQGHNRGGCTEVDDAFKASGLAYDVTQAVHAVDVIEVVGHVIKFKIAAARQVVQLLHWQALKVCEVVFIKHVCVFRCVVALLTRRQACLLAHLKNIGFVLLRCHTNHI